MHQGNTDGRLHIIAIQYFSGAVGVCREIYFCLRLRLAVQSLNSLNDQIASFMVTGPKPVEQEEKTFCLPEKENMQKSMTLMRHLLVDAQVWTATLSGLGGQGVGRAPLKNEILSLYF